MELLVLDTDLIAVDIQDTYQSLIWTDRYDQYGDFELKLPMDSSLLSVLQQNYYLYSTQSEQLSVCRLHAYGKCRKRVCKQIYK